PFEPRHGNCGGSLIQFQPGRTGNALPFRIAKVLYIFDIAPGDCRGRHAHYRTLEIVVCLQGGCTVRLDNGLGRQETVRIERPDRALLLPPRVWRELRDFEPGTRLLAIADTPYDESDYIRDYDRFLAIVRPKENPV
ncbi:MAG: FdtA/QdtA family cupin domain-containing protein, partial [Kiritimatiellia bacterium]|nr:FdtA/QdtA family cupin domain-containing protein [Kiritimatiellia bacterium]